MRESSSASAAHVNRVALIVLRAAAYLIVATGLNEIVAAAAPTYEPLYVYVAIAAVVTIVDGVIFGFPAAVIATAIYLLLYAGRPIALANASFAGEVMFGALLVASAIRLVYQLRRPPPVEEEPADERLPLIEASVISSSDEVVSAIELLRGELRAAVTDVSAAREREREMHAELRDLRARLSESRDAEHALRMSAAGDAERIVQGAQRALDEVNARLQQVEETARTREARLEEAYREARESNVARMEQLERENNAFRGTGRELEAQASGVRDENAALTASLKEVERRAEAALVELAAAESIRAESERAAAALREHAIVLTAELDSVKGRGDDQARRIDALEGQLDEKTRRIAELEEAWRSAQSDLQAAQEKSATLERDAMTLRAATDAAGEAVRKSEELVQSLRSELVAARAEAERVRAMSAGLEEQFENARHELESEIRRLLKELADATAQRDSAHEAHSADTSLLRALESDLEEMTAEADREREARLAAAQALAASEQARLAAAEAHLASEEGRQTLTNDLAAAQAALATAQAALEAAHAEFDSHAERGALEARAGIEDEITSLRSRYEESTRRVADLTTHNETLVEEVRQSRDALTAEVRAHETIVRELTLRAEAAEGASRIERAAAESAVVAADRLREQLEVMSRELESATQQRDGYAHELRTHREDLADRPRVSSGDVEELRELREVREQLLVSLNTAASEMEALAKNAAAAEEVSQKFALELAEERAQRLAADLALSESRIAAQNAAEEAQRTHRELDQLRLTHEQALTAIDHMRRNLESDREHMEASHHRIVQLEEALREALAGDDSHGELASFREALEAAQESVAFLEHAKIELDGKLNDLAVERDSANERADLLQQQVDELRSEAVTAQLEFDRKLQEIVIHLAEDHEADVGQAVMEREEAKAEARSLAARLTALSEQYETERAKWFEARDAMVKRLRQLQARTGMGPAGETPMPPAAQVRGAQADPGPLLASARPIQEAPREISSAPEAQTATPEPPVPEVEVETEIDAPAGFPPAAPHVLVAHPDEQLRELARARLEDVGYRVTTAADGLEGLRRAMADQPDVVIADSSMPKMDGRELCQMLKSQEKTARIKVVLLARSTADIASEPGLKPDEILRKPVRFDLLRSSLASLLAHHAS